MSILLTIVGLVLMVLITVAIYLGLTAKVEGMWPAKIGFTVTLGYMVIGIGHAILLHWECI